MLDFATLYAEHARDVQRFALFLSGDPALADDITSETFIRAWAAQDRFGERPGLSPRHRAQPSPA